MSLAKKFNAVLKKQMNTYAAWQPITNTFTVGSYGHIKNGVFERLGHIFKR